MASLTNSRSLTDFQRNAKAYIDAINDTHEPMLLTVNGKVEAVILDPETYQKAEDEMEQLRFVEAIQEGERAIKEGRTRPAEEFFAELKAKYAL